MANQTITSSSSSQVMNTNNTATLEDFGQGVTREWLYDKRIAVLVRPNTSRECVDAWYNAIKKCYEEWPADQAFIVLSDFSGGYSHTPYATARVKELVAMPKKGYMVYSAAILPRTFARSLIMMVMGTIQILRRKDLDQRLFFDKAEGLAWLKSVMDKVEAGTLPSVMSAAKK